MASLIPVGTLYRNVVPLCVYSLPCGTQIVLSKGSVVQFVGDAIVNAANQSCLGGGGVDGAITAAGGNDLRLAREALPILDNSGTRCRCGDAVITAGGGLNVKYCIHAVGPNYRFETDGDDLLVGAYRNAILRAEERSLKIIAFSLISSGIFRGDKSLEHILEIGLNSIEKNVNSGIEEVHLCAFTDEEAETLQNVANSLLGSLKVST